MPLLCELSCVWLPDIKSSKPQIRASLLKGYIFCLAFCLIFAIWQPCAHAQYSLRKPLQWSENTDKQVSCSLPISMWDVRLKWKCYSACLCSVMRARLFCLRLHLLKHCCFKRKHYCNLELLKLLLGIYNMFLFVLTSFHNVDKESVYLSLWY